MDDISHGNILHIYFFDHAAAAADRFEAEADIGPDKGAVGYKNIAGAAGHFAADYEAAVGAVDDVIANDHILGRPAAFATIFVTSRLDADAIVAGVEGAFFDEDAFAGFDIDAIAVCGPPGIADVDVVKGEVFAKKGM